MTHQITVAGSTQNFYPRALSTYVALRMIKAITHAYMRSLPISSSYQPIEQTDDKAQYICASQLILDNMDDVYMSRAVKNECLYTLKD